MRTRRPNWDYHRWPRPLSQEVLAAERRLSSWVDELLGYLKRGLLTHAEFMRLVGEGPPTEIHKGAALAVEAGIPVDAG